MISTQLFKKIKPLIFFAIFLPSLFWSYQFINGALGVNPIEKLMDNMGEMALRLIVLTLFISSLSEFKKFRFLIEVRRMIGLFALGNTIYDDIIHIDFNRFMNSLSDFSSQMRFDYFMLMTILPVTIGLFFLSRSGIVHAESLLFFISVLLLAGPLVALLTDFYVILPYRFVPLIAFFAIAIGVLIFKTTKSS